MVSGVMLLGSMKLNIWRNYEMKKLWKRKNSGSKNKRKILYNMYIQKRVITKIVVKENKIWLRLKEARKLQSDVAGNKTC